MQFELIETWLEVAHDSDFSIYNLPFGIFSTEKTSARVGVALGEWVVDLTLLAEKGIFDGLDFDPSVLSAPVLNPLMAAGADVRRGLRKALQDFFAIKNKAHKLEKETFLYPQSAVTLHLPVQIGDYTDFYSSEAHARNVGMMFRDPDNALLPNWKHVPVGYHGRASSIYVSGTHFPRPKGQIMPKNADTPVFAATQSLDFELEMAFIIGKKNTDFQPVSTAEAEDYIWGFALFNDWSARDIQRWEYVPLGPFLGKNFFSSLSPWIVTPEALAPFRTQGPPQYPTVLPYLECQKAHHFDVTLDVFLRTRQGEQLHLCRSNYKHLYWNIAQHIAHHTVNGCALNIGDLMASGTISGDTPDSFGSMLELTWGGQRPLTLPNGEERRFIADGDTIIMHAFAEKNGCRIGFGRLENTVLPTI